MTAEPYIWTPGVIVAFSGGIVAILGALGSMIVTLAGLRKKADETGAKVAETAVKVDGHMSAMSKALEVSQAENSGLKALVASQDKSKSVADDLAAKSDPPKRRPPRPHPL